MLHHAHHPVIAVRASLRAGSKVRRPKSLALLASGLILIGANAMATPTQFERCKEVFGFDEVANPHLAKAYEAMCAHVSIETIRAMEEVKFAKNPYQPKINEARE